MQRGTLEDRLVRDEEVELLAGTERDRCAVGRGSGGVGERPARLLHVSESKAKRPRHHLVCVVRDDRCEGAAPRPFSASRQKSAVSTTVLEVSMIPSRRSAPKTAETVLGDRPRSRARARTATGWLGAIKRCAATSSPTLPASASARSRSCLTVGTSALMMGALLCLGTMWMFSRSVESLNTFCERPTKGEQPEDTMPEGGLV